MFRWFLTIFFAVIVFSSVLPWLRKFGLGRLPGDVNFKLFGRQISLPFASTILLSLCVLGIGKII